VRSGFHFGPGKLGFESRSEQLLLSPRGATAESPGTGERVMGYTPSPNSKWTTEERADEVDRKLFGPKQL